MYRIQYRVARLNFIRMFYSKYGAWIAQWDEIIASWQAWLPGFFASTLRGKVGEQDIFKLEIWGLSCSCCGCLHLLPKIQHTLRTVFGSICHIADVLTRFVVNDSNFLACPYKR